MAFGGPQHCYFPLYFIDILHQHRPGSQLSGTKNRTNLSQLGQFLCFFIIENPFLTQKFYALLKKSKMDQLVAREREEMSQKFQRIWIQQI
jgi:hypothetical protein